MPRMDWHQLLGLPNPGDFSILTKELFGEFLGTLWIVFFGCGSVLAPGLPSNDVVQVSIFLEMFTKMNYKILFVTDQFGFWLGCFHRRTFD